jgi:hypothetical protein
MLFSKTLLVAVAALGLIVPGISPVGQESKSRPEPTPEKTSKIDEKDESVGSGEGPSPKLDSLLFQARSTPPEIRSDALIRIAESSLTKTNKSKVDLLEEAFNTAASARFPVKKILFSATAMNSHSDTRVGSLANAYELDFDSVSLRCRSVNALVRIDQAKAKELFSQISIKESISSPLSCQDALIYNVSEYYKTLENVAKHCFNKDQVKQGYRTALVEDSVYGLISPVQIAPIGRSLVSLDFNLDELNRLVGVYCQKMRQIPPDFRAASASETLYSVTDSVRDLIAYCQKRNLDWGSELAASYREYLVRSLSARVCADLAWRSGDLPIMIKRANNRALGWKPIAPEELKPQGIDPSFGENSYWTTPLSKRLLEEVRLLRFGEKERFDDHGLLELGYADKQTMEWRDRFNRVIKLLEDWKSADEPSEEDYLHEKAETLATLIEVVPTEELKSEVLDKALRFLRDFSLDRLNQAEWFWEMEFILRAAGGWDKPLKAGALTKISGSKIPVLALYATLRTEGLWR